MAAAYSLRCPACGSDFLVTQTRAETIITCPHCAHLAPLQTFIASGTAPLGNAPALPLQRREVHPVPSPPPSAIPTLPATPAPSVEPVVFAPAAPALAARRGPANPAFSPLDDIPAGTSFMLPAKRNLGPLKAIFALAVLLLVEGLGWFINRSDPQEAPSSTAPVPQQKPAPTITQSSPPPPGLPPTPAFPPSADPDVSVKNELEEALINSEAPEVMGSLFEGPPQERIQQVHAGDHHADSLEAFFNRTEPVLPGGLKRLPVNPLDLVSGKPSALFQATTSTNRRGALARFYRDSAGKLRLDWALFQETHDATLEQFLESDTDKPQWFHLGIRRSHSLDLPSNFRETHHAFDLQTEPTSLLPRQGSVARDLPMGRYLNQRMDWQAIYLARLLLLKKQLPEGGHVLEILDCEGAGLNRPSVSASAPAESVPAPTIPSQGR